MARDIGEWLGELGLGKYVEAFAENEIGVGALPHLREDDLSAQAPGATARSRPCLTKTKENDINRKPSGGDHAVTDGRPPWWSRCIGTGGRDRQNAHPGERNVMSNIQQAAKSSSGVSRGRNRRGDHDRPA